MNFKSSLIFLLLTAQICHAQQTGSITSRVLAQWTLDENPLENPSDLAVDPNGNIYIADTGNHRIVMLDSLGRFIDEVGGFGWENENFDEPLTVDARNGLDLFVADHNNNRVERYDRDLNFISSFQCGEFWDESLRFDFPRDAALSSQGELFILDGDNNRILKLDVLGEPQVSFGDYDAGEGRLINPQRMAIGRDLVYVSDPGAGHVAVFDVHGNFVLLLGGEILESPLGLGIIDQRFLTVTDTGRKKVFFFTFNGQFAGSIALPFLGEKDEPAAVAAWRNRLYMLNRVDGSITLMHWSIK